MEKKTFYQIISFLIFAGAWGTSLHALEPIIDDYTSYPIFQTNAATPNIHIILDNSGSMNFNAYGTFPGNYNQVPEPYACAKDSNIFNITVSSYTDDAEERVVQQNSWRSSSDLDFAGYYSGSTYNQTLVGVRFQNVPIPQGEVIKRAYIQFTGRRGGDHTGEPTSLVIYGQADDNPGNFNNSNSDISGRPRTTASVAWNNLPDWAHQQNDNDTRTPDITSIVQETVNRPGWADGNSMLFIFERTGATGKRDAYARDGGSSRAPVLHIELDVPGDEACTTVYYGYFDPETRYTYNSVDGLFERDTNGDWDGNWLNWCTTRRIDVLRKVLVGGRAEIRDGSGLTVLQGEIPAQTTRCFSRYLDGTDFTPHSGFYWFGLRYGNLYVDDDSSPWSSPLFTYNLRVKKDQADEPDNFLNGNIAGILQRVGDKARWGNQWFYSDAAGGVANPIGTAIDTLVSNIETRGCNTWTPLAENYYVAMNYFMQQHGSMYTSNNWYPNGNFVANKGSSSDPYYKNGDAIPCAKSFCLFLTDGAPTQDLDIPANLKNYDGDNSETTRLYSSNGSDYLDDIALYARTNDLRDPDLDGEQNLILYTVYAFGNEQNARDLLKDAAKNGGFIDKNDNKIPDLDSEWDDDGNGIPDNYFEAQDGYQLEKELLAAISDILKRAASGTAVSVLATKGEGEGTVVQAYFKPSVTSGLDEIKWVGYLQSLWIDRYGNTREDTNGNKGLDLSEDDIITFFLDPETGETKVKRYSVSADNPYPSTDNESEIISLDEVIPVFETGNNLADMAASNRHIFTYVGDGTEADPNSKFIEFKTANASQIGHFLGVEDNATWSYLGGTDNTTRVSNLIYFIRGVDDNSAEYEGGPVLRGRTMEDGRLWKLGDIVHSTPVSISKPVENYGLLYDDLTYQNYFVQYKNRETVVYVGANDGMLHAFTSGVYDSDNQSFKKISEIAGYTTSIPDSLGIGDIAIGDELWAFIPQNLLPHLKWLPYENYTHVAYVDLQTKVVDARIFNDNSTAHPNGWGTILIGGMRMGGKQITAGGQIFSPSFFALDITNPREPRFLWEKTYPGLGFAINMPCVVKVQDSWFLAIGSGPDDYDGSSTHNGHVYIVDMLTGQMLRDYVTGEANAYMNSPVALDKGMNYNVDAVYVGASYKQGSDWNGRMYKITVPQLGSEYDPFSTDYQDNPLNWDPMIKLFDSPAPLTAPFTLSIDSRDNCWVFAGTGRYIEEADKTTTDQNYIFGIKDPFFNVDNNTCYGQYGLECERSLGDLFDANIVTVKKGGVVEGIAGVSNFVELVEEARKDIYDGWYKTLCSHALASDGTCLGSGPSERVLSKPSILGGILLTPTFAPNSNICGYGGMARLFALYYETGTAYKRRIVGDKSQSTILDVIALGEGLSSSFGIHVGKEEGATAYGQLSTGVIQQIQVYVSGHTSAPLYWREE